MEASLSWVDIAIVAVIALSLLIGLGRGALRTMISIVSWGAAFYFAYTFGDAMSEQMKSYISNDELRLWVIRLGIFIVVLLIGAIIGNILGQLGSGTSVLNRLLGLVLGAGLGIFIVVIAILLSGFTSIPEIALFKNSQLIPYFLDLTEWLKSFLPSEIQQKINLHPVAGATSSNET